jgi:hypothetical protein
MIGPSESALMHVPITTYDIAVALSALLTHPVVRVITRSVGFLGSVSAIFVAARTSLTARRVLACLAVGIVLMFTFGCSSTTEFDGRVVPKTSSDPVKGIYCEKELATYQDAFKLRVRYPDDPVIGTEHIRARDAYDDCSTQHNVERVIVNPFNRIRGLG